MRVLERNQELPASPQFGGTYTFDSPDDHTFVFRYLPTGTKYQARVMSMDGQTLPADFRNLPLVSGPWLATPHLPDGHDGYVEVRAPGSEDTPLVLDFRQATQPVRIDNSAVWQQPQIDRSAAYTDLATRLLNRHPGGSDSDTLAAAALLREFQPPPATAASYRMLFGGTLSTLVSLRGAQYKATAAAEAALLPGAPTAAAAEQAAADVLGALMIASAAEAISVYMQAAADGAPVPDVASALQALAVAVTEGEPGGAELAAQAEQDAAALLRPIAIAQAKQLMDQSVQLASKPGLASQAADVQANAAELLGATTPPVPPDLGFLIMRAEAWRTLVLRLIAAGRTPEAVAPASLAVASYRALADAPGADKPGTAQTLLTLSSQIATAQQQSAAVDAAEAAAQIMGGMTPPVPPDADFLRLLAEAQDTLALRLIAAARSPEAVTPASLAVAAYVALAAVSDVHPVVVSLQDLSKALAAAGLDAAALDAQQAAMRLAAG